LLTPTTRADTTTAEIARYTLGTARVALRFCESAGGARADAGAMPSADGVRLGAPMGISIPNGRINKSMTITPPQNRTRPTNGWKTLMAIDSPHSFPAKKINVMRPRLRSHSRTMPPVSQSTLRTMGPRTIAAKADPTSKNPTTLLTPEHADTMLREKDVPWWLTENSALSDEAAGVARWVHTAILSMASRVTSVKAFSTPSRYFSYG